MNKNFKNDWQLFVATVIFYVLLAVMVAIAIAFSEREAKATEEGLYIYSERFVEEVVVVEAVEDAVEDAVSEVREVAGPTQRFSETLEEIKESKADDVDILEPIKEVTPLDEPVAPVKLQPVKKMEYYDVPLDEALQGHIFALCEDYGIDPSIIIAMIKKESTFKSDAIGDNGNSFGLMQIQQRFHQERMDRLGCTDLLDPYQNVMVGIDLLGELIDMDRGLEWALMAYNGGYAYANKKVSEGVLSAYAETVLATSKTY